MSKEILDLVDVIEDPMLFNKIPKNINSTYKFLGKEWNIPFAAISSLCIGIASTVTGTILNNNPMAVEAIKATSTLINSVKTASDTIFNNLYYNKILIVELDFLKTIINNFQIYYDALSNFSEYYNIDIYNLHQYNEYINHVFLFLNEFRLAGPIYILKLTSPEKYRLYIKDLLYWHDIFYTQMLSTYKLANESINNIKNMSVKQRSNAINLLRTQLSNNKDIFQIPNSTF